jgi:WD40 repeat protein
VLSLLAFSPPRHLLATATQGDTKDITIWRPESAEVVRTLSGLSNSPLFVVIAVLVSGTEEEVRIWDVETGKKLRTFVGELGIIALSFPPAGAC